MTILKHRFFNLFDVTVINRGIRQVLDDFCDHWKHKISNKLEIKNLMIINNFQWDIS